MHIFFVNFTSWTWNKFIKIVIFAIKKIIVSKNETKIEKVFLYFTKEITIMLLGSESCAALT